MHLFLCWDALLADVIMRMMPYNFKDEKHQHYKADGPGYEIRQPHLDGYENEITTFGHILTL